MKVLVTGGRHFAEFRKDTPPNMVQAELARVEAERKLFWETLDRVHREGGVRRVISGDATGADARSLEWANEHGVHHWGCRADWNTYGRAAGPIRNQRMLSHGPDLVIAFPGGAGTADMVQRARRARFDILMVET